MAKTPGAMWISGTDLHFVDKNGNEWYCTGYSTGQTPAGARKGALWIDSSSGTLYYIDANGTMRYVPNVSDGQNASATPGATWIDTFLRWVDGQRNLRHLHSDVSHTDSPHIDYPGHTDNIYSNVPHSDYWVDYFNDYGQHGDGGVLSGHGDTVTNPHSDGHGDYHNIPHTDTYTYIDSYPYGDYPYYDYPHSDVPISLGK